MTNDEIKVLTEEEIKTRSAEIMAELDNVTDDTDVEGLESEVKALEERRAEILAEKETRAADIKAVLEGEGVDITNTIPEIKEEKSMENSVELRNTQEYIHAYAESIRKHDENFSECRKLLTTNGLATNGDNTVPVPDIVYSTIQTAWDKEGVMARVKKAYIKGNVKVGVEIGADAAAIHAEGAAAPSEEELILATVLLVPFTIKKWISFSDEVLDLDDGAFLQYIFDELTYQIAKKTANEVIAKIAACGTVSTNTPTTNIAVPQVVTTAITQSLVSQALGQLSDEASNPCIIMNKSTWAAFKAVQYAGQFNADPFEGLEVIFNNSISTWSAATTGVPIAYVGDLGEGVLVNFPNGEEIKTVLDYTAKADLVEAVGRRPVAMGVVKPNVICAIKADKTAD